jgi:large subunit ribosomal protein L3
MNIGLLGHKVGMTKIFDESGNIIPVTILNVGPCIVTQVKKEPKDSYNAIQIGYGTVSKKPLNKPQQGHIKNIKSSDFQSIQPLKYLKEFRVSYECACDFQRGQVLNLDSLSPGQLVDVQGKSIGKGFAGLQKRHNFTRGPMTHGSKNHRAPGSIGMATTPGRVLPGKKMAGQLGNKTTTVKKLKVIQFNTEENLLVLKGSIPGKPGNLLKIIPYY